jgi:taurine dioxygenase
VALDEGGGLDGQPGSPSIIPNDGQENAMATIEPSGQILGATVRGVDLSCSLDDADFATILLALGRHGVLRFPDQRLEAAALRDFSQRFGGIQDMLTGFHEPGMPEVGILSNVVENGRPIGLADAGQDWHTDMSYNPTIGFLNVLYAVKVPRRDGRVLGATAFVNTHAAYDDLPSEVKTRLREATATHDFNKFWENMRRRPGSRRGPMSDEQRRKRPPSVHAVFLTHPITGRTVLYCNPGYALRINEVDEGESDRLLDMLFAHQLQPKYQYRHRWTEGDVLVWDHIGTLHNAIADYGPDEHRLMKRCQVMADKIFDPGFLRRWLPEGAGVSALS